MRQDTICALCTPAGKGALAVIRVSGPEASKKIRKFVRLPEVLESHRVYTRIFKGEDSALDQVVLTYFEKGRSFTGEETFEISCHGGPWIYNSILQALLKEGLRMAQPGEFSLRSFYNGKQDLVQVEGLFQLIESRNERARRSAFFQMQGQLSLKLKGLERKWLHLLSHLEADIDFSMEGLNILSANDIKKALKELLQEVCELIDRYQPFEHLQRGLTVGLFGPVNSGKSTLFNRLLGEEKAIVTAEEGTTRDIVEGQIRNSSLHISLKDTAGFGKSLSLAEKTGQDKTRQLFFNCEVPVVVLDAQKFLALIERPDPLEAILSEFDVAFLEKKRGVVGLSAKLRDQEKEDGKVFQEDHHTVPGENSFGKCSQMKSKEKAVEFFLKEGLLAVTKKDLCRGLEKKEILDKLDLPVPSTNVFYFSNLEQSQKGDFSRFKKRLLSLSLTHQKGEEKGEEDFFITSLRHFNGFQKMKEALKETLHLQKGLGERDLMALNLRQGLAHLYEITGRKLDDQVLDTLFKKFCIGK